MIDGFLLGVIATASLTAGAFFLKFWRKTHDAFFLAFGASFLIEGFNRAAILFAEKPNEGDLWTYLIRLLSLVLVLIAILRKNYSG
ncbi:MAG TPA: DUF5985 family protein [Bryobacteraceae bacterium]|jgi:uncharacterized membrane protein HdeD (DUF308 family)